MRRVLCHAGLGLLVGAVLHGEAAAQVVRDTSRARGDTTRARADTSAVPLPARSDSAARRAAADTIKTPLPRAEAPALMEIGQSYRWDRRSIFSSGALSLAELLAQVPGVTVFHSSWIAGPHNDAYLGNLTRIRVFLDGVELDPLDARDGGAFDMSQIQLWTLEDVAVERGADELRVYLRSWRVERTTPFTRVDVATGDLETNAYRGYYGRRFGDGAALQLGAQQYSTSDNRVGGDGDLLAIFGRLGWAKKNWRADIVYHRTHHTVAAQRRLGTRPILSPEDAVDVAGYARAGYGDPEGPVWLQLIAATQRFSESSAQASSSGGDTPVDSVDTTAVRSQYLATAGVRRVGLALSATARLRDIEGTHFLVPSARLSFDRKPFGLSVFAERSTLDSALRGDAMVRVSPFSFFSITGTAGHSEPIAEHDAPSTLTLRGEAGIRLGRLWLSGGVIRSDTAVLRPPIVFDTGFVADTVGQRTAYTASMRGPVWKGIGFDVQAIRWDAEYAYTPQYQVRSVLSAQTSWLRKFPSGAFHILLQIQHDYRTAALFPVSGGEFLRSSQYRTWSSLLELTLYDAVLFWQFRNFIGADYETVPGFEAPRQTSLYGVRWQFFN